MTVRSFTDFAGNICYAPRNDEELAAAIIQIEYDGYVLTDTAGCWEKKLHEGWEAGKPAPSANHHYRLAQYTNAFII